MSDQDGKKTLGVRGGGGPRSGNVKQSFSHGRTKNVVVETKRKRTVQAPKPGTGSGSGKQSNLAAAAAGAKRPAGISDAEMERRLKALQAAKAREADDAAKREAEEKARAEERDRMRAEKEQKEREQREAEERAKAKVEEEERKKREEADAAKKAAEAPAQAAQPEPAQQPRGGRAAPSKQQEVPRKTEREGRGKSKGDGNRRTGKLTVSQALSGGEGGRQKSMAAMKRKQERARQKAMGGPVQREKVMRDVRLPEAITVAELANRMTERVGDVVKALMQNGVMATQNQTIDADTAELIIEEFGHTVVRVSDADVEDVIATIEDKAEDLKPRAPIITIMGHVDHGKTSLLDAIRKTKVVSGEAGGITQHIGAYQVPDPSTGATLTFLDTPGHAAFTSMRSRGAQVTDIVVLVVAADDAVMPQTIEAINHAKAAKVPMIVAINKCDKPEANPTKVRTDLLQHEIVVEEMSGDVQDIEVSALSGKGLPDLLEAIALQAEILELKANPDRAAEGAVIEAQLDVGRGPVATVLVQKGTLKQGDIFVVGEQWGKVRAMENDQGQRVKEAGPSVPVEVLGLNGTPEAGDVLNVVSTEAQAREIAEYRQQAAKDKRAAAGAATTLEALMQKAKEDENVAELPVLVKADVQGSAEAIVQALEKVGNDEVRVRVLHYGVGAITETDVGLAEASNAPILGFNVRANASARNSANQKGVELRYYSVIYDLVDDVKKAASGLLSAEVRENFIGYAKILETFRVSGVGTVAGCLVTEGVARRSAGVRLLRDDVVIHEGTLKTLKRFKDEVAEVISGQECGMAFENYDDVRKDDVIEIFTRQEIERTLE
ncbi:translation initiation factor IF-2 [Roseivivax halodurans JCM 10272]|uniref:Translation initiation factor IF-2 n=1 Tax=Roseivivax halodurans JCM 10272 TaxID=1449350 RepID=X7EHX9_9RHOB|nr:translation initiation factor IF-2 [Roseivivax halodurans]ETX15714.1 translation initiation factor IF-2 [Roseivivax halodurans JCM 10272]